MDAGIYAVPPATLTDLYELTMAAGYWKLGRGEERAVFNLFFRQQPFEGGFSVAAGLARVVDFLERFRYCEPELSHLASVAGPDGSPLFEPAFIEYLRDLRLTLDVDAIPRGRSSSRTSRSSAWRGRSSRPNSSKRRS